LETSRLQWTTVPAGELECMNPALSPPSDEALLLAMVRGQEGAFDIVYSRYARVVMSVAYRVVRDADAAAEITQTTFMRLWERAPRIESRPGYLRPWLLTVARNAGIDWLRLHKRELSVRERTVADARDQQVDVENAAILSGQRAGARDLLRTLSDDQRQIVELAFFGGLTQAQIAQSTGVPLGTVKSRLRLAMKHLRSQLSADAGEYQ